MPNVVLIKVTAMSTVNGLVAARPIGVEALMHTVNGKDLMIFEVRLF